MATQATMVTRKRPGPAATGKGHTVGVRLQPDLLERLDAFIAAQPKPVTRPEAIRAFVVAGLHLMGAPELQHLASARVASSETG